MSFLEPQDPDRPTMQEMLHLLTETANELLRAFKSETYQVNYDVGFQLEDALTEHAGGVLSCPVAITCCARRQAEWVL
jgi:hypothetical protein